MTYVLPEMTITTWGRDAAGRQRWRARAGERVVEFTASRQAMLSTLIRKARKCLKDAE
jgi:hypothetical protein